MVEIELGDYANCETTKDGDIAEICKEAEYQEIDDKNNPGKKKKLLNVPILVNGKELLYSPSWKIQKEFVNKWGKNTKSWVGHKFQILHKDIEIAGKELKVIRVTGLI